MRFSTKTSHVTTNIAGGRAFSMTGKEELVHAVLTTFLENKAYESGDERLERIKLLCTKVPDDFVAKLAIFARTKFHLRSVSHVLAGELSKTHRGDSLVMNMLEKVIIRPDDMVEILAYVGKPVPNQLKRGLRHAILKFDEYQLAKYKGEGHEWSLIDIFNLVHPNPKFATKEQKLAWKKLINKELVSFDTWESELSNAKNKKLALEKLIRDDNIGYMAILRNLNNFIKYNISDIAQKRVIKKLTDPEEVAKSKQLPFRFYTAYKNVIGSRAYSDAISEAMDIAVGNAPELSGKTLIGIDTSGSMSGDPIEKAAIFGAALMKANVNTDVILYDTGVKEFTGSGRVPVVDLADRIIHEAMGGGTETSLVFQYALQKGKVYDRFIIISDNESWADTGSVQQHYTAYKKGTGTDPHVYAIDIEGYGTKDISSPRVRHFAGWSDKILEYMKHNENGALIKDIDSLEL